MIKDACGRVVKRYSVRSKQPCVCDSLKGSVCGQVCALSAACQLRLNDSEEAPQGRTLCLHGLIGECSERTKSDSVPFSNELTHL